MADRACSAVGSARRRRERRLRAMLRQERQTVAMELAAALHHSCDVGFGTNDGLRAQTTASAGKRLAPLEEVAEPQVGAVTVGYVAAPGPLLVVASLAGGDEVNATTVSFLLRENLMLQKIQGGGEGEEVARAAEGDEGGVHGAHRPSGASLLFKRAG